MVSAAVVIVVAGLSAAQVVLLPLFMSLFLAVLCMPPMSWLRRRGLPSWAATLIVITAASAAVLGVAVVIGGTIQRFHQELPFYRTRLDGIVQSGLAYISSFGFELSAEELSAKINTGAVMELAGATAGSLVSAFSSLVIVLLLTAFLLLELAGLPGKLRRALGDPAADLTGLSNAARQVQRYLAIKTVMSMLNAALAIGICAALGIEFPLLWGLLAFLFNYVPNIGSFLSAIPPVLLALVQYGPARAALAASLYLVLDFLSGYVLEPRIMGRRLGLSPFVVIVALLFWGWLWGPVGVLLAVPITSVMKILLEHSEDLRWAAVLLDSDAPPTDEAEGATMPAGPR